MTQRCVLVIIATSEITVGTFLQTNKKTLKEIHSMQRTAFGWFMAISFVHIYKHQYGFGLPAILKQRYAYYNAKSDILTILYSNKNIFA